MYGTMLQVLTARLLLVHRHTLIHILFIGTYLFSVLAIHFYYSLEKYGENAVSDGFNAQVQTKDLLHKNSSFFLRRASLADPPSSTKEPHVYHTRVKSTNSTKEGLSACLLVNDENPRLPEWLAYHYYTLPLRSLIIAIDPASKSSPKAILDLFSSTLDDLDVTYWDSEEYYLSPDQRMTCDPNDVKAAHAFLWIHRQQQQHFVMKCMETFEKRGKSWVLLTDVDEYVTLNMVHPDDPPSPLDSAPKGIPALKHWKVM
jgi:hypothetical protein